MAGTNQIPGAVLGNQRRIYMGLGEAILRLVHVELLYATNTGVESELVAERNLIVQALNQQYQLDLGFDCNADSVPDTVEIFQQTAKTSCCRILPMEGDTSDRKGKFDSGRRIEAMPDIEAVKENLADFMAKTPLNKTKKSAAPKKESEPKTTESDGELKEAKPDGELKEAKPDGGAKPKGFFASLLKDKEPKKERGVRKPKE